MCSLYLGDQIISGQATLVGESRNIGQIIPSAIPLTDAGLHLLDGALIQGDGIYSAFVDYIAGLDLTANYFCTEVEWQTAVTTYGVCGKFVYDITNNTVRLPKYSNKIYTQELDATAPVVGNGTALGFTDGTYNFGTTVMNNAYGSATIRAYQNTYGVNNGTSGAGGDAPTNSVAIGITTDATKSGLVAQLSDITTSLDGYYYIVIATSTKTDIQLDIDEVVTDLNGKADTDLSNVPNSKGILTESYKNGTSWYRVYSDGWCEQGGRLASTGTGNYVSGSITFLKQFINTNYQCFIMSSGTGDAYTGLTYNKTTTTISYGHVLSNQGADWQACGYIN